MEISQASRLVCVCLRDRQRRAPLRGEDVQADGAVRVDVAVVDLRGEVHLEGDPSGRFVANQRSWQREAERRTRPIVCDLMQNELCTMAASQEATVNGP